MFPLTFVTCAEAVIILVQDLRRKLPVTRTLFPWHNTLAFSLTRDLAKELALGKWSLQAMSLDSFKWIFFLSPCHVLFCRLYYSYDVTKTTLIFWYVSFIVPVIVNQEHRLLLRIAFPENIHPFTYPTGVSSRSKNLCPLLLCKASVDLVFVKSPMRWIITGVMHGWQNLSSGDRSWDWPNNAQTC